MKVMKKEKPRKMLVKQKGRFVLIIVDSAGILKTTNYTNHYTSTLFMRLKKTRHLEQDKIREKGRSLI